MKPLPSEPKKPVVRPSTSLSLENGAELNAYSKRHDLALVINDSDTVDVISYADPGKPQRLESLTLQGSALAIQVSSKGLIAVASAEESGDQGQVEFFQIRKDSTIRSKGRLQVGRLPTSLAFSPDGSTLVVANEGEPDALYGTELGTDPEGAIALVRLASQNPARSRVEILNFRNDTTRQLRRAGLRISGPGKATPATDLEPGAVAVSADGQRAFVALQENNGIAEVDIANGQIRNIFTAGVVDFKASGRFDTSDEDGGYKPGPRNFFGLRMPGGVATFDRNGKTYLITANEGDARVRPDEANFTAPEDGVYHYGTTGGGSVVASFEDPITGKTLLITDSPQRDGGSFEAEAEDEFYVTLKFGAVSDDGFYSDEIRAGDLRGHRSNPIVSGEGEGRLKTVADQNSKSKLYAFGGRSFTIYDSLTGEVLYDSGDLLDRIASQAGVYDDDRSDDKSIEPESVTTATLGGRSFAFLALEQTTHTIIPVFDVSNPARPIYEQLFESPGSVSPEGLSFVPTGPRSGVLLVANSDSGTLDSFPFSV